MMGKRQLDAPDGFPSPPTSLMIPLTRIKISPSFNKVTPFKG